MQHMPWDTRKKMENGILAVDLGTKKLYIFASKLQSECNQLHLPQGNIGLSGFIHHAQLCLPTDLLGLLA